MLLALDTATYDSGIALFDGQRLVAELNWRSASGQTVELTPRLAQLLAWQGLQPAALSAVAVSLGPGSFTGLRVALSAAKGMVLARQLPLLGVPTLDATAYPHLGRLQPVAALIAAGRGRVCWAIYRPHAAAGFQPAAIGGWSGWRTAYRLTSLEELAAHVEDATCFVGELSPPTRKALAAALGDRAILASPSLAPRRAGVLAELAWSRLDSGQQDDPARLSPIYLREPEEKW